MDGREDGIAAYMTYWAWCVWSHVEPDLSGSDSSTCAGKITNFLPPTVTNETNEWKVEFRITFGVTEENVTRFFLTTKYSVENTICFLTLIFLFKILGDKKAKSGSCDFFFFFGFCFQRTDISNSILHLLYLLIEIHSQLARSLNENMCT